MRIRCGGVNTDCPPSAGLADFVPSTPVFKVFDIFTNLHIEFAAKRSLGTRKMPKRRFFHVKTVHDFLPDARLSSRRGRLSSKACRMCRVRKVKCELVNNPDQRSCRACEQADLDCLWDTKDGRKQRKLNAGSEQSGNTTTEARPSQAGSSSTEDLLSPENKGERAFSPVFSEGRLPDHHNEAFDLFGIGDSTGSIRHSDSPTTWQQADFLEMSDGYLGGLNMSQSWTAGEDFLLDLDAVPLPGHQEVASFGIPTTTMQAKPIRLHLFRRYGPTAVAPGLKRLSMVVEKHLDDDPRRPLENMGRAGVSASPQGTPLPIQSSALQSNMVLDYFYGIPSAVLYQLLDVFFQTFGGLFPFLNKRILAGHVRSKQASKFLISSILALTARFCSEDVLQLSSDENPHPDHPWRRGERFLKAAKEQLWCLLPVPAPDVVAGLIVLSWAEFGSNSGEGSLWIFSGLAIRMAQDLGLHRSDATVFDPQTAFHDRAPPSPEGVEFISDDQSALHQQKSRLVMFWSVFSLDIYVSLLMGRPPMIRRGEIEVPLPTISDMIPVHLDFECSENMSHKVFPATAHLMYIFSEVVELFNLKEAPDAILSIEEIDNLEKELAKYHKNLDPGLMFNPKTYRESLKDEHAGIFLVLHLYLYTFAALLAARKQQSLAGLEGRSRRSSCVACQKISQVLAVAEAIGDKGYTATPFLTYSIFVAASNLLEHMGTDGETGDLIDGVDSADLDALIKKLGDMARFFHGVNATIDVICQKKRGLGHGAGKSTAGVGDAEHQSVIEPRDEGIINRYAVPTHFG